METNKKKRVYRMELDEADPASGVFALSLVENPAIQADFVYLSKQIEMVKLATVDTDKRIIIGPALIPELLINRIDPRSGEEYDITFPEETVLRIAELYLQRQMNNNTTLEHQQSVEDVSVVQSWVVENPRADLSNTYGMEWPKGTWMVKMRVNNEEVWQDYVKTGKVKGISLEGAFNHEPLEMSEDDRLIGELIDILRGYSETLRDTQIAE